MLIPGITVLGLYILIFKRPIIKNSDLGLSICGIKYWIIAPIGLVILNSIIYGVSFLVNPDLIESKKNIVQFLTNSGFYWGNIWIGIALISVVNAFLGSLVNIPMYLGQELGWRAFMIPRLLKVLKPQMAFLVGGILWAIWHYLLHLQVSTFTGSSILDFFGMVIICIPLGIIFQYVYFRSKSIFAAAITHGALSESFVSSSFLLADKNLDMLYFTTTGLIGILIFWAVALILYKNMDWQNIDNN